MIRQLACVAVLSTAAGCGAQPAAPAPPAPPAPIPIDAAPSASASDPEQTVLDRLQALANSDAGNVAPDLKADALFRLAALSSQRERSRPGADLPSRLQGPISVMRRIAREFPSYPRMRHVYYQLGHDLREAARLDEAAQVWRSLVCHDLHVYPVAPNPVDPERDSVLPRVQDHPKAFWEQWIRKHPDPSSVAKPSAQPDAEERFRNPYPDTCTPLAGDDASQRMIAEIWFRLGEDHFDGLDEAAGVYSLNRAAVAFSKALAAPGGDSKVRALASYKLAWTLFKQQRYEAAARQFVEVLRLNAGDDFQRESATYIAGSLVNVDLVGPGESEPFIPRADVLDREKSPAAAEQKMRVGLKRVQSASLIPQDQPWTPAIYLALAREYRELNQLRNAIDTFDALISRWPAHRQGLQARLERALCWESLWRIDRKHRAKAVAAFQEVLQQARPGGLWRDAHNSDQTAIEEATKILPIVEQHLRALP